MKDKNNKVYKVSLKLEQELQKLQKESPDVFWAMVSGRGAADDVHVSIGGRGLDVLPGIALLVARIAELDDHPAKAAKQMFKSMEQSVVLAFKQKKKAARKAGKDGGD